MTDLEQLLSDTLRERAQRAPAEAPVVSRVLYPAARRRWRWVPPALVAGAAASVFVLSVTVLPNVMSGGDDSAPAAGATATATQAPDATAPADGSDGGDDGTTDVPDGWRPVTLHGVRLHVPADWTVGQQQCGSATADTVLDMAEGTDGCFAPESPTLTVVRVFDTALASDSEVLRGLEPAADDPIAGRRWSGDTPPPLTPAESPESRSREALVLSDAAVTVVVDSPDRALARRIVATARAVGH